MKGVIKSITVGNTTKTMFGRKELVELTLCVNTREYKVSHYIYNGDYKGFVIGEQCEFEVDPIISRFTRRLENIGVKVELVDNFPWIYLDKVNGIKVLERYRAVHGFTALFDPLRKGDIPKFTDRRLVFSIIRKYLKEKEGE